MPNNILEKWQDISAANIPPLESRGFTENVLHRDIWSKSVKTQQPKTPAAESESANPPEPRQTQNMNLGTDMDAAPSSEEQTTLLIGPDPEEDQTVLLTADEPQERAYIIRMNTNERIDLDKPEFTIGKSAKADYQIHGNDAISRKHIQITKRDAGYELEDLDSLNHTYIEEREIHTPVLLNDKQTFKLADEEFCFYIEEA